MSIMAKVLTATSRFLRNPMANIAWNDLTQVRFMASVVDQNFLRNAEELASCRVTTSGTKRYFVDLKRHYGPEQTTFVKISELSKGRRASLILGFEDISYFVQKLEVVQQEYDSKSLSNLAYKFTSKTFVSKSYEVKADSNSAGKYVVVREVTDGEQKSQIYIPFSDVINVIEAVKSVANLAA